MWQQILDYFKRVVALTQKTQQNSDDIDDLREELDNLSDVVRELIFEVRGNHAENRHEREKLLLQVENKMLRFERCLPPPARDS